jgi:peptide/nickel transport system permease protein
VKDRATPFAVFWSEFGENRVAVAALGVVVLVVLLAVFAPLVAPQDPYDLAKLTLRDARRPPGFVGAAGYVHWLGTDAQGRDMFSAILFGLKISLQISVTAGLIALTVGATLGAAAAFLGGRTEALIMRIIDLQLSFPAILLALVLAAILGQGKIQLTIALIAAQYAYFARTAHGAAVAERSKEYIEAALSVPLPVRTVIFRHILPNCLPPLIVVATVQIANAIALEATLSFLGLGLPPTEPSLGLLIANGFQYMLSGRYWISIYPGIALVALIVAVNLVGDQIRDQFNPRLKR